MDETFISIVVPTYNRAHLIAETIQSLAEINYKNYEIIIVDDGSTDNTEEVISQFLNEKVTYHKKIMQKEQQQEITEQI
ncbi:MAG: glycosyltransferase family 2 protein [Sphingobacteriales bacterium]|nr:MAG: glycosyltransferase family 2 protein [Sphingobacteriales bacterium]